MESVENSRLNLKHHRIRVIGADAATTLGRYGLRGEAAYTITEDFQGTHRDRKHPFLFMVLGGDRTLFEYVNVNLQYLLRVIDRYQNPLEISEPLQRTLAIQQAVISNQFDRVQHGASVRISDKWLHETLEAEVVGLFSFTRRGYAARAKMSYAFTDHWKSILGMDLFRGDRYSFFGYLRDNSTIYLELRRSF